MSREPKIDVAKGVLITLVVFGHLLEVLAPGSTPDGTPGWHVLPQQFLLTTIYLVHMPLFVFLAGTTSRSASRMPRIRQFLVLYAAFQLGYSLLFQGLGLAVVIVPYFALWFLVGMVVWNLGLPLLDRWPTASLTVSLAIGLLVVLGPFSAGDLSYVRVLGYLPFFVLGHRYGHRVVVLSRRLAAPWVRLVALLCFAGIGFAVTTLALSPDWVQSTATVRDTGASLLGALVIRSGVMVAMAVCCILLLLVLPPSGRLIELVGRRSLAVFVLHMPIVEGIRSLGVAATLPPIALVPVALGASVTIVAVLSLPVFDRALRQFGSLPDRLLARGVPAGRPLGARPVAAGAGRPETGVRGAALSD